MVLQHGVPVNVWGKTKTETNVDVWFRGQKYSTVSDEKGQWKLVLDPLTPGGPDDFTINGIDGETVYKDVLVGDVWFGSGQSNMAGTIGAYAPGDPGLASLLEQAPYDNVRLFASGNARATWTLADATSLEAFSANLGVCGIALQKRLGIPVGLMFGAKGGTSSCFWLSKDMYRESAECAAVLAKGPSASSKPWMDDRRRLSFEVDYLQRKGMPVSERFIDCTCPWGEPRGEIGHLYEQFIRPCVPYTVKGILWDQGEAGSGIGGLDQYAMMGALIKGWRKAWGYPYLPFFYYQKPSGGIAPFDPDDLFWAGAAPFKPTYQSMHYMYMPGEGFAREPYIRMADYPNTFMVGTADLSTGIHPPIKTSYGLRAFHRIAKEIYGINDLPDGLGPVYLKHWQDEGSVVVLITNTGGRLLTRHATPLQGFCAASANQAFVASSAEVLYDHPNLTAIRVYNPAIERPVAVRYAWAAVPQWANVYGENKLPLQPFRTDDWDA